PFEHIAVSSRQAVEHRLDELTRLGSAIAIAGFAFVRRCDGLEHGLKLGAVVDHHDALALASMRSQVVDDLSPADLAYPREHRGVSAIRGQAAYRFDHRSLHDLLRGLDIAAEPR